MPILKNQEVWIETGGLRYEEYDVKVEGNVIKCYIASQVGKTFRIMWKNHTVPLAVSSSLHFKLDGVILDEVASGLHIRTTTSKGYRIDKTSFREYRFSDITFSDDEGISSISNEFGTISVEVRRVHIVKSLPKDHVYVPHTLPNDMGMPLNERSKKIGSHRVELDDTVQKQEIPTNFCKTLPFNGEQGPFASFRFIYRPKEMLQALEVIPAARPEGGKRVRSPSPIPEPSSSRDDRRKKAKTRLPKVKVETEIIDLSDDDQAEQELLAQQAEIARKLKQLRNRTAGGAAGVKVKT